MGGPAGIGCVRAVPGHHAYRAQATPGRTRRLITPDSTGRISGHDGRGDAEIVKSLLIHRAFRPWHGQAPDQPQPAAHVRHADHPVCMVTPFA